MKNLARYSGIFGIIFILFGGLGYFGVTGLGRNLVAIQFFSGVALVILFLSFYVGDTLATISERRDAIFGGIGAVFLFSVLVAVNIIANSHWGENKFDLTTNKIHSLSSETQTILKNLNSPIEIWAFLPPGAREQDLLKSLVEKYTYFSKQIIFHAADPDKEPGLMKEMDAAPEEVLVRNAKTKKQLKLTGITEEGLTLTIRRVMSDTAKVAYFLRGHGEGELDGNKPDGLYVAKFLLENEGFVVKPLNLVDVSAVPADASVVAAWGAQRPFSGEEVNRLLHYLERGGQIILGQDPLMAPTKDKFIPSGLEPLLERVGLQFEPAIILEYQVQLFRGRVINPKLALSRFENHGITKGLGQDGVAEFYFAQALTEKTKKDSSGTKGKVTLQKLASSSEESWAEKDLRSVFVSKTPQPQGDTSGPLAVGYVAEFEVDAAIKDKISSKAKLVVFGDADFATTQMIQGGYNRDLFLNSFNYVTGEEGSLTIRPKTWSSSTLNMSDDLRRTVNLLVLTLIPQIILLIAGMVWVSRRQLV